MSFDCWNRAIEESSNAFDWHLIVIQFLQFLAIQQLSRKSSWIILPPISAPSSIVPNHFLEKVFVLCSVYPPVIDWDGTDVLEGYIAQILIKVESKIREILANTQLTRTEGRIKREIDYLKGKLDESSRKKSVDYISFSAAISKVQRLNVSEENLI